MKRYFAAAATAALLAIPAAAIAAPSATSFVKEAIKGDNSEIMLGKLAQKQGGSQDVKQFGQTLETDHTEAKQQMADLAQRLHVTPPTQPVDKAKAEYRKLSGMQGQSFDREFASYMVKDHKSDIQKFETEAKAGNRASSLAQQQLPTLRKHLKIAQSLQSGQQAAR